MIVWGAVDLGVVPGTFFAWTGCFGTLAGVPVSFRVPRDTLIKNLQVHQASLPGGGLVTYTVQLDGVDTALSVAVDGLASDGANMVDAFDAPEGSLITLAVTVPPSLPSGLRRAIITAQGL